MAELPEDPFIMIKREIQMNIQKMHDIYGQCHGQGGDEEKGGLPPWGDEVAMQELEQRRGQLKTLLESVTLDVKDLEAAIRNIEANPYRFSIDMTELSHRKEFVKVTRSTLATCQAEVQRLEDASSRPPLRRFSKQPLLPSSSRSHSPASHDPLLDPSPRTTPPSFSSHAKAAPTSVFQIHAEATSPYFYESQLQQQQLQMKLQDEQLDAMTGTIGIIKEQAYMIHTELSEHNLLLNDMEIHMDAVEGKLGRIMKRLNRFYRNSKYDMNGFMLVLIVILIALMIVLIII